MLGSDGVPEPDGEAADPLDEGEPDEDAEPDALGLTVDVRLGGAELLGELDSEPVLLRLGSWVDA